MVEWWFQVNFKLGEYWKEISTGYTGRHPADLFIYILQLWSFPRKRGVKNGQRKRGREGEGTKPHLFPLDFTTPAKSLKTFMIPLGTWSWHMTQRGDVIIKIVISNYKCRACEIMLFLCKCIPEIGASQKLDLHITVHIDSYCQAASIFVHLPFSLG